MISIIIPLYNKEKTIKRAIESVLQQSYKNFELLVIDDGSIDNSKIIVENISDSRIIYEFKQNGGVSSARNYGARKASSQWLFFLDADDIMLPGALDTFACNIEKVKNVEVFVAGFKCEENGLTKKKLPHKTGLIKRPLRSWWLHGIFPRTGNMLISKFAFFALGGFDERVSYNEDFGFVLKMLNNYEVYSLKYFTMVYTEDDKSLSVRPTPIAKEYGNYLSCLSIENKYSNYFIYWQYVWTYQRRIKMCDFKEANDILAEIKSRFSLFERIRNVILQKIASAYNKIKQ